MPSKAEATEISLQAVYVTPKQNMGNGSHRILQNSSVVRNIGNILRGIIFSFILVHFAIFG